MKKFIVSGLLIVSFSIYSLLQQRTNAEAEPVFVAKTTQDETPENIDSTLNQINSEQVITPPPTVTPPPATTTTKIPDVTNNKPSNTAPPPPPPPKPTPPPPPATTPQPSHKYNDGTYVGLVENAFYGNVQIQTTIQNDKIVSVQFLQYPNKQTESQKINTRATPILSSEAIKAQSASVDTVSGATHTSRAFVQSLASALNQAKT